MSLTFFGRLGLTAVSLYPMAAYSLAFSAGVISSSKPERYETGGHKSIRNRSTFIYGILWNIRNLLSVPWNSRAQILSRTSFAELHRYRAQSNLLSWHLWFVFHCLQTSSTSSRTSPVTVLPPPSPQDGISWSPPLRPTTPATEYARVNRCGSIRN